MKQDVSCRVSASILKYLQKEKGASGLILSGIEFPEEHLIDPTSWISLDVIHLLFERAEQTFFDEDAAYKIGLAASQGSGWGVLDSVFRMIGEPKLIYHQAKKFGAYFYKNADLKVIDKKDLSVTIHFEGENLNHSDIKYLKGALAGVPQYWDLPHANLRGQPGNIVEFSWDPKPGFFGQNEVRTALSPKLIQDAIDQLEHTRILLEKKNSELESRNLSLREANRRLKEITKEKAQSEKIMTDGQHAIKIVQEMQEPISTVVQNVNRLREYLTSSLTIINWYEQFSDIFQQDDEEELKRFQKKLDGLKEQLEISYIKEEFPKILGDSLDKLNKIRKAIKEFQPNFISNIEEAEPKKTLELVNNEVRI